MRNIANILPLKSKLSGNVSVSVLLMEVSKCRKIVEFPKISIKMKNFKTFDKDQTASHLKESTHAHTHTRTHAHTHTHTR